MDDNKMQDRETQCKQIIEHIEKFGGITSLEASQQYYITRLPARVWDLRNKYGYPVIGVYQYKLDADGKVLKKWKLYKLEAMA